MGSYNIPRNVKGEGRILFIFSIKSLMYTGIGLVLGYPIYFILSKLKIGFVGFIVMGFLGLLGFLIGTFKFPEFGNLRFTKIVGGENIDDIIKRAFLFKKNGRKLYMYTKEEEKNG